MKKIVFLVSGNGGNLKFMYFALKALKIEAEIVGVIGDRDCEALTFANEKEIHANKIKYNRNHIQELQKVLNLIKPDVIVTNIHKIIDTETLNMFPGQFINLHYSLLPSFKGLIGMETVSNAKKMNVGFIGATCHIVDEELDEGLILQQSCFVADWSSDGEIIDTVFKTSCLILLGGIIKTMNINILETTTKLTLNKKEITFSPALPFSENSLFSNIWEQMKNKF